MTFPITADDFGLHHSANRAIIQEIKNRPVTRVSVLVNGCTAIEVFNFIKTHPHSIKVGLHLNLVEGYPVCDPHTIPTLVRKNGRFYSLPVLLFRLWMGKVEARHLALEMVAQLRRLQSTGVTVEHINSHQNCHVLPPLQAMVIELARCHHIQHVRQESSVVRRLRRFPTKLIIYYGLQWFMQLRYQKISTNTWPAFEEFIFHPGTNYD